MVESMFAVFLIENPKKSRKWNKMHMSSIFRDMMESFSFASVIHLQHNRAVSCETALLY